jgi:DNA polymerase III subunit delta'
VETREGLREADKKDTRLFVQTHPDVLIIPPDPPQMMIKVDQVRRVIETIYYRPAEARERVYIFTDSAFMKEAANSLLKVLEEPPEFATIFLLSENPGELLPTIRSRSMVFPLGAVPVEEVERYLAEHRPEWKPRSALWCKTERRSAGAGAKFRCRGLRGGPRRWADHSQLGFAGRRTHRAVQRSQSLIAPAPRDERRRNSFSRTLYSLLRDLMFLGSGAPELVHNTDIQSQLTKLAESADFEWIVAASDRLAEVERGMRRNLLRSLSLDALELGLEKV